MSSFTWLDYSEHDRQKALQVVRLFAEKGTVDELGIGTVRDAFSDILFPGTSTLHTRARYFFFVPWVYRRLENRKWGSAAEVAAQARKDEIALIDALADAGDEDGIIGIDARDTLKNLPSLLYWQGLYVLDFRLVEDGQAAFHRRLAGALRSRRVEVIKTDDGDPVGLRPVMLWHPGIPPAPKAFPQAASFQLSKAEARFLQDRARERVGQSLLAWLLKEGAGSDEAEVPWQHPRLGEMRSDHRNQLRHARNFSECMHGAPLLYNLMLAERAERDGLVKRYRKELADWAKTMRERTGELQSWNQAEMWSLVLRQNPRIPFRTQGFARAWLELATNPTSASSVTKDSQVRQRIEDRERALKGPQARLVNRKALGRWNGESGTTALAYRWPNVRRIVTDVLAAC